jgi:chemotaxis family two-component system sensor kinase Cph1
VTAVNRPPGVVTDEMLERCAQEPIHVPGAIQPHGVLLALDGPEPRVTTISDNAGQWLGIEARRLVGAPIEVAIGAPAAATVRKALATKPLAEVNPLRLVIADRTFDGIVHRHAGATLLELEPADERADRPLSRDKALGPIVTRLLEAREAGALMNFVVEELRRLTGFDRVLAYRFDEDGNGTVVAEAKGGAMPSFLGHHYPASDIPRQARELYRLNWLRAIPDAAYEPVPLLAADPGARPLDLSLSVLRSVSPVHREYMAHMGVRASLTISVLPRGALWGLLTCHHAVPRFIPYEVRAACELLGKLLSLQLTALQDLEDERVRSELAGAAARVASAMRDARDDTLEGLVAEPDALLQLVSAGGAAVVTDETIHLFGRTPSHPEVRALVEWLRARNDSSVFVSRKLSAVYSPAACYTAVASGILTLALPRPTPPHVIWFRPEEIETVSWGGNPHKAVELGADGVRLHPRTSFAAWKEEVRGRSLPWSRGEIAAAGEVRRTAIELELGRQVGREQAAVRARDEMLAVVSHDMRNLIGVVKLQVELLWQLLALEKIDPSRELRAAIERIQSAAGWMTTLVTDLLDAARIEAGEVRLNPRPCRVAGVVDAAVRLLSPLADQRHVTLTVAIGEDVRELSVVVDSDRIFQVLSNLLGNAIKFTPEGGHIEVSIRSAAAGVEIRVRDSGPGIPLADQQRIFDRYWQASPRHQTGSGLGLYIARGLVEAHGGTLWVESVPGQGAVFAFTVPVT